MIIGYVGNLGSGKTLSLVRLAYSYYKKGYEVYSNISLNFPHKKLNFSDFARYSKSNKQFNKSFFLLDELHMSFDSRRSASYVNIVMSHLILQSRKRDITIGYTTQSFNQVDLRLRQQTDIVSICTNNEFKGVKIITLHYMIFRAEGTKTRRERYVANRYYSLYDTREIVAFA